MNRRRFIGLTSSGISAVMIIPRHTLGGRGFIAPSDKLNIAGIGVGGQGAWDLKSVETENIIALCDVDWERAAESFERFPTARRYRDFRIMLEKEKEIDGGIIPARPDELEDNRELSREDGMIFVGSKGKIYVEGWGGQSPRIIPETKMQEYSQPPKTLKRSIGHHAEWIKTCKEGTPTRSNFQFASLITETVLLGTVCVRLGGKKLYWDSKNIKITNAEEANTHLHYTYRSGWHLFTADPSAHVWADGRLYVYPSHDVAPPRGCDLMDRYHVFSTNDMVHWTDHGEILNSGQVPWGRAEGGFMWAPDCAYKNGMYYFYFPHPSETEWNTSWKIGIAISNKPASNFTVKGYIENLEPMIDPCIFIDDDGQAYFYYGGRGVCKGGKLKENMYEIDGEMQDMALGRLS